MGYAIFYVLVTNALMKQEFLDEIARISLVISKRIAVATGVPEEALSANKGAMSL